jgi:hypothetical protein
MFYGRGTFVCQDCHGVKKCRNSKRCTPCNYKSKEWEEIQREGQTKRYEDPAEREKMRKATRKRFEDPAEREKTGKAVKNSAKFQSVVRAEKFRVRMRKATKKRFDDPEERRKTGEASRRGWMKRKQAWKPDQSKS